MKKRIFTLFALGIVLSSVFSAVKAQGIYIDSVTVYTGGCSNEGIYESYQVNNDGTIDDSNAPVLYGRIIIPMTVAIPRDTTITIDASGAAQYLNFPTSYVLKKRAANMLQNDTVSFTLRGDAVWEDMPSSANGTSGTITTMFDTISASKKDTSFVFYNMPQVDITFYSPTIQFPGRLKLSMSGGADPSSYTRYIIYYNGGESYSTQPEVFGVDFAESEIDLLEWTDTIWVENGCQTIAVPLSQRINPGPDPDPNPVLRSVTFLKMQNAHYVGVQVGTVNLASTKDFTFKVVLTGDNVGMVPVLKTTRKAPEVLGQTWTCTKDADNTYIIVIKKIQEPFTVSFDFEEGGVGNEDIADGNSIWSANGQLYVTSAVAANAKVYSVAGALVKTVALAAGETASASLPTGLYIVTLNNNSYKVVVQ